CWTLDVGRDDSVRNHDWRTRARPATGTLSDWAPQSQLPVGSIPVHSRHSCSTIVGTPRAAFRRDRCGWNTLGADGATERESDRLALESLAASHHSTVLLPCSGRGRSRAN